MTNQIVGGLGDRRHTAHLEELLASYGNVGSAEIERLRSTLRASETSHRMGMVIDSRSNAVGARLVTRGWVARCAVFPDGRRQIVTLNLPGDVISDPSTGGRDMGVWALTSAGTVDADAFRKFAEEAACDGSPLGRAWRKIREAETLRLIHQVIRLGRLTAYERTAHLFLELHDRQLRTGLTQASLIHIPVTQDVLADSLGLSTVHMNRILQQMRRDGLIIYRGGTVVLPDVPGLEQAARLAPA